LIPGREITTFQGHANVFGITRFLDFRIGGDRIPNMNIMLQSAKKAGGLISINHPNALTGKSCMGCGWQAASTDWNLVSAIEAVNGGAERGPYSGVTFWERQLADGHRITAIGGTDNHHPDWPFERIGSVGSPTTVVFADELSVGAILNGVRAGHVFVDLTGSPNRILDFTASTGNSNVMAGDILSVKAGEEVALGVHISRCRGANLRLTDNQTTSAWQAAAISNDDQSFRYKWTSDSKAHRFRADVVSGDGELQILSNPIYLISSYK
jgi:hypothetical protein